jgi:hypothetical protein
MPSTLRRTRSGPRFRMMFRKVQRVYRARRLATVAQFPGCVWNKHLWRAPHKNVPRGVSVEEWEQGSVALRRQRKVGWFRDHSEYQRTGTAEDTILIQPHRRAS